jgi:hypothetical protein
MGSSRRTEVVIETHEVWVIRRPGQASAAWCGGCAAHVLMLPPEAAARLSDVTPRTIYRWVEAGLIHFTEAADGALLICLKSLPVADTAPVSRGGETHEAG